MNKLSGSEIKHQKQTAVVVQCDNCSYKEVCSTRISVEHLIKQFKEEVDKLEPWTTGCVSQSMDIFFNIKLANCDHFKPIQFISDDMMSGMKPVCTNDPDGAGFGV